MGKSYKILIDLRYLDYGESGGIEIVAYYLIDSLAKNNNLEIILDVKHSSRDILISKYQSYKNVRIISDPIEGLYHKIKSKYKTIGKWISIFDKVLFYIFHIELFRPRKKWANSIVADVVIYTHHLRSVQHDNIPVISFMHALLPNYGARQFQALETHIHKAAALVSLWNYPMQEFIQKYPFRKDSWHLLPAFLTVNINSNDIEEVEGVGSNYWLFVSFFVERKNHLNLVHAYKLAYDRNPTIPDLVFVGNGHKDYYEQVMNLVNKLQLTNKIKIYFGFMSHGKVAYLYKHTLGVVSPTLWEAASGAVVEGCLAGVPVACSNVPPLTDFSKHFNLDMIFFDPLNIVDISEKLLFLHSHREEYRKVGKNNAEILNKYDKEYYSTEMMRIIESVVNKN